MGIFDKLFKKTPVTQDDETNVPAAAATDNSSVDKLLENIDSCAAILHKTQLTPEQIDQYTEYLTLMKKSIAGLNPVQDVSILMDALNLAFSNSIRLVFRFGEENDCKDAIATVNKSIACIPSKEKSEILIGALSLGILHNTARILQQNCQIARYQLEIGKYRQEQQKVLDRAGKTDPLDLDPHDANMIFQIDQKIVARENLIKGAKTFINTYGQEIVSIEISIQNIEFDPDTYQAKEADELLAQMRAQAPSAAELALALEEAGKKADEISAQVEADAKLIENTIDHNMPMPSPDRLKAIGQQLNPATLTKEQEKAENETITQTGETDTMVI